MKITRKLFEEITFFGGLFFYLSVIIYFLFSDRFFYSQILFYSLLIIYGLTLVIRLFYFRKRPSPETYHNLLQKIDASSFPSVHAARATVLFIFLTRFYYSLTVVILSMFLLIIVFYSRIYLKKHDLFDLLGGLILGILSALTFFI